MNILYHCSEYPPFKSGGIGSVTKIVAEELAKKGHNIYIVGYYPNIEKKQIVDNVNNVTIYRLNLYPNRNRYSILLHRLLNNCRMDRRYIQRQLSWYETQIEQLIQQLNIDIFEMSDFYEFNTHKCKLRFKKFSIPTILRVHGSVSFMHFYSGKVNSYALANDRAHFARLNNISSVSKFAQEYVDKMMHDIKFDNRFVIHNPIETDFIRENLPSEKKQILFIGKLIKTKGAFRVLSVFSRIHKDYNDWELHVVGPGDVDNASKYATAEALKSIKFLGFCDRNKICNEIDNCSYACIPSYFETFGMVPIEIMARKRSVIFTKRASGAEIVNDGLDGYTVDPDDEDELYEKMLTLINEKQVRDKLAQRGFDKVNTQFAANTLCDKMIEAYKILIHNS